MNPAPTLLASPVATLGSRFHCYGIVEWQPVLSEAKDRTLLPISVGSKSSI